MDMPVLDFLKVSSLPVFYIAMFLGLLLHVLIEIDAWWKPEWAKPDDGITWTDYFAMYPFRTPIAVTASVLICLLLWDLGARNALWAAGAGYLGLELLDRMLGKRKPGS